MSPRIERTRGLILRWRVIYPIDHGMDVETLHFTRLGARFYLSFWDRL